MESIYVWSLLAIIIATLTVSFVCFGRIIIGQRHKIKALRQQSMLEDLELATSEQLLSELRRRNGQPYVLLSPMHNEDSHGITIEVHNISPIPCFHMLHMATGLTFQALKNRGVEIPDFDDNGFDDNGFYGDIHDEGEEWKN